MEQFLLSVFETVDYIVDWVASSYYMIITTPILLLTTGFFVLGGTIGIFGRLLSRD